jgi:hypothetical protein
LLKPKRLTRFLLITALEGAAALLLMFQTPSVGQRALFAGLSGQRLVLAAVDGTLLLLLSAMIIFLWLQPVLMRQMCQRLDGFFCARGQLLAASFYLVTGALLFLGASLVSTAAGWQRILERVMPLAGWFFLTCLQLLFVLWISYKAIYQRPVSLKDAANQFLATSFLGKLDFWLGMTLVAIAGIVLRVGTTIGLGHIPTHDSGIFLYFGSQILNGRVPFRDLWDHKPPLIFYIDALGLLLANRALWGVWLMEFISLSIGALFAFRFLRRYVSPFAAVFVVAATLANIVFLLEGGNLTEEYALPLQWATLFLAAVGVEGDWHGRRGTLIAFGIGLLFSLALSLKQTMIGIWVTLGIFLFSQAIFSPHKRLWLILFWMGIGALVGFLGWALYFTMNGAFNDYWSVAYVYNFLYSDVPAMRRGAMLIEMFTYLASTSGYFVLAMLAWAASLVIAVRAFAKHRHEGVQKALESANSHFWFPLVIILIDMPVEIALINTSGKNFRHYFLSILPGYSVLVGWLLNELLARVKNIAIVFKVAGGLLCIGLVFGPAIIEMNRLLQPSTEATIQDTVKYIQEHTSAKDYVLMWGSQTTVNFLSGRQAPTRFVHQKPLFRPGYANAALSAEMLADLSTKTPKLIINTHLPSTPFLDIEKDGTCHYPDGPLPAGMDVVFQFICQNYEIETVITKDQWEVYHYKW